MLKKKSTSLAFQNCLIKMLELKKCKTNVFCKQWILNLLLFSSKLCKCTHTLMGNVRSWNRWFPYKWNKYSIDFFNERIILNLWRWKGGLRKGQFKSGVSTERLCYQKYYPSNSSCVPCRHGICYGCRNIIHISFLFHLDKN